MMISIKLIVMLLKITPNEIILEHTFKINFPAQTPQQDSHSKFAKRSRSFYILHFTF